MLFWINTEEKQKKQAKKINKTICNKNALKKCEIFCKKDYLPEMTRRIKLSNKKHKVKYIPPYKRRYRI